MAEKITIKVEPLYFDSSENAEEAKPEYNMKNDDTEKDIASDEKARRVRVTYTQLEVLYEFLHQRPELVKGYNKSTLARDNFRKKWISAAAVLNQIEGATKTWKEWSSYWIDFKSKLRKKKLAANQSEDHQFSEIDAKFIALLDNTVTARTAASPGESSNTFTMALSKIPVDQLKVPPETQPLNDTAMSKLTDPEVEPSPAEGGQAAPGGKEAPPGGKLVRHRRKRFISQEEARRSLVEISKARLEVDKRNQEIWEKMLVALERIADRIDSGVEAEQATTAHGSLTNIDYVIVKSEVCSSPIKQESEENGFILPDMETPQEPVISEDGVTEEKLNANAVPKGIHVCEVCTRRFNTKTFLKEHMILHSRQKLECHICSERLRNLNDYEGHLMDHTLGKYKCDECSKRFPSNAKMLKHKLTHLPYEPVTCANCFKQFPKKKSLIKHLARTLSKCTNETMKCEFCDKEFLKENLLRSHLRKHATERPFQCNLCQIFFKYKSALVRHIRRHNNDKPYQCEFCDKAFDSASSRKRHQLSHTGEKPFSCEFCKKTFAYKHNMLNHLKRHSKKKNLDCLVCQKAFPTESRLIYHMKSHTNSRPFGCDVCVKKFSNKQNLMTHYQKKHPNANYVITTSDATAAKAVWKKIQKKFKDEGSIE